MNIRPNTIGAIKDILMKKLITVTIFLSLSILVFPQAWKTYPFTPSGSLISFPADEGRHTSEPIEWWYTSGHLTGQTSGNNYSYMLSYFYNPLLSFDGFRILNISDDDAGLFRAETKALFYNILSTDSLNIMANIFTGGTERWQNKIDTDGRALPFEYEIFAESEFGVIDLEYDALKPPLILADSGYLYQGPGDYTYYYSQTENEVNGTITFNGITENVTGTSWIDRQYGIVNPATGFQYEWFCLQLSNGIDLNVYNIFNNDYEIPESLEYRFMSAYVDETTQYTTSDLEIERLEYSFTPDLLRCYSQQWRITSSINEIDVLVTTLHSDSEVQLPFKFYEGSVSITGSVNGSNVTGVGFTELLHSYEIPDLTIDETTNLDSDSTILSWHLSNPDDGNPLKYDLDYSIDNQQSFLTIDQSLDDTLYYWDTQSLSEEEIWFRLRGYSIDETIFSSDVKKLISSATSIDNARVNEEYTIYPNPTNGQFTIEGENIKRIEVISLTGVPVYSISEPHSLYTIDIRGLPKGVYIINVSTGRSSSARKIILK